MATLRDLQGKESPPVSTQYLRHSLGLVYLCFGSLKLVPEVSPAESLATQTLTLISPPFVGVDVSYFCLAIVECAIGTGLMLSVLPRLTFTLFIIHIAGTMIPLFAFPELAFTFSPLAPTLLTQYIFKNIVLLAAGWTVLCPHLRGSCVSLDEAGVQEVVSESDL